MKTKKMSTDQFARFIAKELLKVKQYNFDLFYDISKITDLYIENMSKTGAPIFDTWFLMLRDTGSHFIHSTDINYDMYANNNSKIYKLKFCYNRDYFYAKYQFCEVTLIKNEKQK